MSADVGSTWAVSGIFWLYLHRRESYFSSWRRSALFSLSVFLILMGAFILVGGLYASIKDIANGYTTGTRARISEANPGRQVRLALWLHGAHDLGSRMLYTDDCINTCTATPIDVARARSPRSTAFLHRAR